ncbi:MAG: hypothetical protein ACFWTZ_02475 [Burkholderia sp.]|jgi:hypothetical protein
MKVRTLTELIRYHYQRNDREFDRLTDNVIAEFRSTGHDAVANYIQTLRDPAANSLFPQSLTPSPGYLKSSKAGSESETFKLFSEITPQAVKLPWPSGLATELTGIKHALQGRGLLSKFLFIGSPGTGKTAAVAQLAEETGRRLYSLNLSSLIDSRMGETAKNIDRLFYELAQTHSPESKMFLVDEIDAIALNRTDQNDVREMGRATSAFIRGMDSLPDSIVVFATTNLGNMLDEALHRRFDHTVSFDRYSHSDLVRSALFLLQASLPPNSLTEPDYRLAKKIFEIPEKLPAPGILKNKIRTAIAFSDSSERYGYFKLLYTNFVGDDQFNIPELRKRQFTLREIEMLTGISKSQIARIASKEQE